MIIFDIGGYFVNCLKELNKFDRIKGIVEDTENGYKKYERSLYDYSENRIPIFSIARSRVKSYENYLVGRSIAESTLGLLTQNNVNLEGKKIEIISPSKPRDKAGERSLGVAFEKVSRLVGSLRRVGNGDTRLEVSVK